MRTCSFIIAGRSIVPWPITSNSCWKLPEPMPRSNLRRVIHDIEATLYVMWAPVRSGKRDFVGRVEATVLELVEEAEVDRLVHVDVRDRRVDRREDLLGVRERFSGEHHRTRAVSKEGVDGGRRGIGLELRESGELRRRRRGVGQDRVLGQQARGYHRA